VQQAGSRVQRTRCLIRFLVEQVFLSVHEYDVFLKTLLFDREMNFFADADGGDTHVGSRWYRARLTCTTRAALCGRSPVRIRAVSRPYGPQTGRERSVCLGPSDGKGEPLMQHCCVRALLIVPLNVQAGTYPAASWTIGDRKQTTVWCAGSFAE